MAGDCMVTIKIENLEQLKARIEELRNAMRKGFFSDTMLDELIPAIENIQKTHVEVKECDDCYYENVDITEENLDAVTKACRIGCCSKCHCNFKEK